jgi:hypothetical protein
MNAQTRKQVTSISERLAAVLSTLEISTRN